MIAMQLNKLAAAKPTVRSGSGRGQASTGWAFFLATASAVLGQNSDLSIPNFGNPLSPPSNLGNGTGDLSILNNSTSLTAPGADNGVLHDVNLSRNLPYIAPISHPNPQYNVKLGNATMLFTGSVAMSYTDNALQDVGRASHDDFSFTPALGISLNLPFNRDHAFRISVGVGYRYSLNYSRLNSLYIAPSSYIDYQFKVGDVVFTIYDQLTSGGDTTQRLDLRNQGTTSGINFNRVDNQIGLSAAYSLSRDTSLVGGYSFGINRGLSDAYSSFDSNGHGLSTALYHRLHPRLTVGLAASYNIVEYQQGIYRLNNSSGWSVGPVISYRPTDSINLSTSIRYSSIAYESLGSLQVASNPSSITFDLSATHRINRHLLHLLTASRAYNNSVSSAQMEVLSVGYGLHWQALRKTILSADFHWQNYQQNANVLGSRYPTVSSFVDKYIGQPGPSGTPLTSSDLMGYYNLFAYQDQGDYVSAALTGSYQISSRIGASLTYSYTVRESSVHSAFRPSGVNSYKANTVSLNLGYRF